MTDRQDSALDVSHRVIADRYRLETSIGQGAMGTVWSGTDELLHRSVAVKELKLAPDLPEDEAAELRERAVREARAMAVVTHPNTVLLYDVAWDGNTPFVVMELVAGQSLAKILDKHGPLDHRLAALVVDGVAAALQAAHRLGIVHRDVKPANVLVGKHGEIKLSDFGIARNSADPTLTRTGFVLGTPAFLAPEIAVGEGVEPSADLWSLGTMLFLAAEGRLPYDDIDPFVIASSIINGKVPQHHQNGPIGEVISGLMVKDPAGRMPLEEVRRRVYRLLPEGGTNPFYPLLDLNDPALRIGDRSSTRRLPHDGTATGQPWSGGQHAPTPPRSTLLANGTAPASPSVKPRRGLIVVMSVVTAVLLGVVGFLVSLNNRGDTSGNGQTPERGVPPSSRNAFRLIQAEAYNRAYPGDVPAYPLKDADGQEHWAIEVRRGSTFLYQQIDFGPTPPVKFYAEFYNPHRDPDLRIELRLDNPRNEPISTIDIEDTGSEGTWLVSTNLVPPVTGFHDVYLTLGPKDGNPYGPVNTGDWTALDWFCFEL